MTLLPSFKEEIIHLLRQGHIRCAGQEILSLFYTVALGLLQDGQINLTMEERRKKLKDFLTSTGKCLLEAADEI